MSLDEEYAAARADVQSTTIPRLTDDEFRLLVIEVRRMKERMLRMELALVRSAHEHEGDAIYTGLRLGVSDP